MPLRSARRELLVVLALLALVASCGGNGTAFPFAPKRLVTDDVASTDVALALGLHPVGASSAALASPALSPYLRDVESLGGAGSPSANLDAIAGLKPDAVLAPSSLEAYRGQLARTAPTLFVSSGSEPWQQLLLTTAARLGRTRRAEAVVSVLGLRAKAIREQVAGKMVGFIDVVSPSTFASINDDAPLAAMLARDLGLRNVRFPPQQYPSGCAAAPSPPEPCATNRSYVGSVSKMRAANALLVVGALVPLRAFAHNAYFATLPAARHAAFAPSYEVAGPLGASNTYDAVVRAFGLDELHGGTVVAVTVDPATRHVCWAAATAVSTLSVAAHAVDLRGRDGCITAPPALVAHFEDAVVRVGGRERRLSAGASPVVGGRGA